MGSPKLIGRMAATMSNPQTNQANQGVRALLRRPLEIALAISSRKGIRRAMPLPAAEGSQRRSSQGNGSASASHGQSNSDMPQSIISATIGHFAVDQASQGFTHRLAQRGHLGLRE